jgi:hypothetical protein
MKNTLNFLVAFFCLTSSLALAGDKPPKTTFYGKLSSFFNGEMHPMYKTKIEFTFPQCLIDSHLLNVERRDSETFLTNPDSGKKEPVRYVLLVGRLNGSHKNCKTGVKETQLQYEIESDPKRMTHFFISTESPAKVSSVQNSQK